VTTYLRGADAQHLQPMNSDEVTSDSGQSGGE
jgi:hypothetical protein